MAKRQAKTAKKASFAATMNKNKSAWEKARKVKDTGGGDFPDPAEKAKELGLEDGDSVNYPSRVTGCKLGVDRKGNGYANLSFIGIGGAGKDVKLQKGHFFNEQEIKTGDHKGEIISVGDKLERFFIDLSRMGENGYFPDEGESFSPEDLEEIAKDITKTKPGTKLRVRFLNGYINVFLNKGISDEDVTEYVNGETNGTVVEEEKVTEEEEIEEEEIEDVDPEEGMFCIWKSPRMKEPADFKVVSVDKSAKTVKLQRDSDSKEFNDIAWDVIELYDE